MDLKNKKHLNILFALVGTLISYLFLSGVFIEIPYEEIWEFQFPWYVDIFFVPYYITFSIMAEAQYVLGFLSLLVAGPLLYLIAPFFYWYFIASLGWKAVSIYQTLVSVYKK